MRDPISSGRASKRPLRPNSAYTKNSIPQKEVIPSPEPINPETAQEINAINELLNFEDEEDNNYCGLIQNPYSTLYHPNQTFHNAQNSNYRKMSDPPLESRKLQKRNSEKLKRNSFEDIDDIMGVTKHNEWEKLLAGESSKYFNNHKGNLGSH
jgi:hypothetical protein